VQWAEPDVAQTTRSEPSFSVWSEATRSGEDTLAYPIELLPHLRPYWWRATDCSPSARGLLHGPVGPDRVTRHVLRGVYIFVAVVVCPLVAWDLAVDATNRGFGWRGFVILLLGLPVVGAVVAAVLLRRRRRETVFGAIGAVTVTFVLVVVLIFVTLSSR